jgi:predicted DsbA family dithiol-disulfide isomerase
MAHAMAMETPRVQAEVVAVQEFPHLAQMFAVRAVPKTVVNGMVEVLGAVPEQVLLQRVLIASGREDLMEQAGLDQADDTVPTGPTTGVGS